MRKIKTIVIHCSASPNFRHTTVNDIDRWHKQRGFKRVNPLINNELFAIGYHYVIYIDGSVHSGRSVEEVGAHVAGWNANTIGICMIGTDDFTAGQWDSLKDLVKKMQLDHIGAGVCGHRDFPNVHKDCPGFDVFAWYADNLM